MTTDPWPGTLTTSSGGWPGPPPDPQPRQTATSAQRKQGWIDRASVVIGGATVPAPRPAPQAAPGIDGGSGFLRGGGCIRMPGMSSARGQLRTIDPAEPAGQEDSRRPRRRSLLKCEYR